MSAVTAYRVEQCAGRGCSNFTEIATVSAGPRPSRPAHAVSESQLFPGRQRNANHLERLTHLEYPSGLGCQRLLQTFDFHSLRELPRVARPQLHLACGARNCPKFCGLPTDRASPPDFTVGPHPWQRTGPGNGYRWRSKFDLTKFDQGYFDRLRARTQALNAAGIYAGVYLFTRRMAGGYRCASDGYPFTAPNNVNGVNGGDGIGSMTMTSPNAITAFQDAFVEKVIDTLSDLPNVLWIVSEEAPGESTWWNDHQISHIRSYESEQDRCVIRLATASFRTLSTPRSSTATPTGSRQVRGSPRRPAVGAARRDARSTSTIPTTAISGCGTTRLRPTGTTPGKIS